VIKLLQLLIVGLPKSNSSECLWRNLRFAIATTKLLTGIEIMYVSVESKVEKNPFF